MPASDSNLIFSVCRPVDIALPNLGQRIIIFGIGNFPRLIPVKFPGDDGGSDYDDDGRQNVGKVDGRPHPSWANSLIGCLAAAPARPRETPARIIRPKPAVRRRMDR
jgi:hypothetical protein